MSKEVVICEAQSLTEIQNNINSIYLDAEQKNLDATIVSFTKTAGYVSTNMYGGYPEITPCYTAVIEFTPKGTSQ